MAHSHQLAGPAGPFDCLGFVLVFAAILLNRVVCDTLEKAPVSCVVMAEMQFALSWMFELAKPQRRRSRALPPHHFLETPSGMPFRCIAPQSSANGCFQHLDRCFTAKFVTSYARSFHPLRLPAPRSSHSSLLSPHIQSYAATDLSINVPWIFNLGKFLGECQCSTVDLLTATRHLGSKGAASMRRHRLL